MHRTSARVLSCRKKVVRSRRDVVWQLKNITRTTAAHGTSARFRRLPLSCSTPTPITILLLAMNDKAQLPPLYCALGGENAALQDSEIKKTLHNFLASFDDIQNLLVLPPDFTRFHSQVKAPRGQGTKKNSTSLYISKSSCSSFFSKFTGGEDYSIYWWVLQ